MKNKGKLTVNVCLNVIKQCCNILFPLITYPYAARILGEEALGRFSFSDSIVSYFMVFATLGIPTYAIREGARFRDDKEKIECFVSEIYTINVFSMIGCYIILSIVLILVPRIYKDRIFIIILSMNIVTSVFGRDWVNSIYEDFFYITVRYIVCQFICMVLLFGFVHKPGDIYAYTVIMMLSNSAGYVLNFFYTQKYVSIRFTRKVELKKHMKSIIYLFCTTIALTVYIKSDITILGFLKSDSEVGIYTFTSKIYMIVKALLNAMITVTIPRLVNYLGQKEIRKYDLLLNILKNGLYILVLPSIVGLYFLAPDIILLLGGKNFLLGYESLRILCIALLFAVFGCYYSQSILIPFREEKKFFYATLVSAIVNIVGNVLIIPFLGMNGAAITTLVAEMLVFLICRFFSLRYTEIGEANGLLSIMIGCIGIGIICELVGLLKISLLFRIILSLFGSVILYTVILFALHNAFIIYMFSEMMKKLRIQKEKK